MIKPLLIRARARITSPEHWTQGAFAKTVSGKRCLPNSRFAASWCAIGAIDASLEPGEYELRDEAIDALSNAVPRKILLASSYNDHPHRKHKEILSLFDRAIKAAR